MNAYLKQIGGFALQQQGEIDPVLAPEPVRYAKSLQCDVSLEVQEWRQQRRRCRIMIRNRLQIEARRFD